MADPPSGGGAAGEDKFGFLVRKVGPLPVWAWGAIVVGAYYWYTHYGPGAKTAAAASTTPADTGSVTEKFKNTYSPTTPSPGTPAPPPSPSPQPGRVVVPPSSPPPAPQQELTVPNVVGQRANFAIGELESSGLSWHNTTGDRNPADEYVVQSQDPSAGARVARGTSVGLAFKQIG